MGVGDDSACDQAMRFNVAVRWDSEIVML